MAILFGLVSPQTAWQLRPMVAQYGLILVIVLVVFARVDSSAKVSIA